MSMEALVDFKSKSPVIGSGWEEGRVWGMGYRSSGV